MFICLCWVCVFVVCLGTCVVFVFVAPSIRFPLLFVNPKSCIKPSFFLRVTRNRTPLVTYDLASLSSASETESACDSEAEFISETSKRPLRSSRDSASGSEAESISQAEKRPLRTSKNPNFEKGNSASETNKRPRRISRY